MRKVREKTVIASLEIATREAGGVRAFARAHGFDAGFISKVINGGEKMTDRLAACLGYQRKVKTIVDYFQE